MKIVIFGSKGQLGSEFVKFFLNLKINFRYFSHDDVDITNIEKVYNVLSNFKPTVVINCAAYTNVEMAEKEVDKAYKINSIGAKILSYVTYKIESKIVYFSTDYVFDGSKTTPYKEYDLTNPLSIYGKSKLLGEKLTKIHNPNFIILRTSWLYGFHSNNFIKKIINLAKNTNKINVVYDQIGTPTYTLDLVKQTWLLINTNSVGLYHSSNIGETSWYDFANEIKKELDLKIDIIPIKSEEYNTNVRRPKYSVLENYFLKLEDKNIMRDWREAFKDFINNYRKELL